MNLTAEQRARVVTNMRPGSALEPINVPTRRRKTGQSGLEKDFWAKWQLLKGPPLVEQHRFHPTRKWRFDFAHLASKVAVEIQGGIWSHGAHVRGGQYQRDRAKIVTAQELGWIVYELTDKQINAEWIERIVGMIELRGQIKLEGRIA
jgi:very-short-patch-repair endonuclease